MKRLATGATCAVLAGLAGAGPAAAQDGTCRASAARATVPAVGVAVEPVRANANGTPCTSQSASTVAKTTIGPVTVDAVGAFTDQTGAAFASASQPNVVLGPLTVSATAVQASASAPCNGAATGSSRVVGLVVNGTPVTLPLGDARLEIPLGPLGSVVLNDEVKDGATLTRRAVHVKTPAGEVVLAEAIAAPARCKDAATIRAACPDGADFDDTRNVCVITEDDDDDDDGGNNNTGGGGGGGGGGSSSNSNTNTSVGAPFQGPQGGTVVTIEEARKIAPKSPCVKGKGPKYAILGTKKRDKITGTNRSERIILRGGNDNAEGGRGNDCIDGGKGRDTMSGALGKDRIYGGKGKDALIGGSHADRLYGGPKGDTINSGYGKDFIKAGKGADKINAATAGPPSKRIHCGKGRGDKVRINRNERKKLRACNKVYVIR